MIIMIFEFKIMITAFVVVLLCGSILRFFGKNYEDKGFVKKLTDVIFNIFLLSVIVAVVFFVIGMWKI